MLLTIIYTQTHTHVKTHTATSYLTGELARAVLGLADAAHQQEGAVKGVVQEGVLQEVPRAQQQKWTRREIMQQGVLRTQMVQCVEQKGGAQDRILQEQKQEAQCVEQEEGNARGVMRSVAAVPAADLRQAAHPSFVWGTRAKKGKAQALSVSGSSSSRSSSTTTIGSSGSCRQNGLDVGSSSSSSSRVNGSSTAYQIGASITKAVCAMTPDQLSLVLVGLAKWQQQQQQQQQQQAGAQGGMPQKIEAEWLQAMLALIQVRERSQIELTS